LLGTNDLFLFIFFSRDTPPHKLNLADHSFAPRAEKRSQTDTPTAPSHRSRDLLQGLASSLLTTTIKRLMSLFLTSSGILPPFASTTSASNGTTSVLVDDDAVASSSSSVSFPKRLLGLVRSLDKQKNPSDDDSDAGTAAGTVSASAVEDSTVDLLNHLIALYSRRGLLQGNSSVAEQILASSTTNNAQKGSKKKKGGNGKKSNEMGIHDGASQQQQQQADEALIFTAILRILPSLSNSTTRLDDDKALLVSLASELSVAIFQHVTQNHEISNTCALAEYELLAQYGKAILTGLHNAMEMVIKDATNSSESKSKCCCLTLLELDSARHVQPLNSTIKAACCLVALFGTKLSRSTQLMQDLHTTCLHVLTAADLSVQESSAKLLACLPLVGCTDRTTPSDLWNSQLSILLSTVSTVLTTMAPLTKFSSQESTVNRSTVADDHFYNVTSTTRMLEDWIHVVRHTISDESMRVECFQRFMFGLTMAICSLMRQDQPAHLGSALVDAQVDVTKMLKVIELFVAFPLTAESTFHKTKKRLRVDLVDGGLLSPKAIAAQVSNHVKQLGHELLNVMLASMGGSVLFPFTRRIFRICYASILTSSSGSIRKVMDPTSVAQLEGKRRRWLHLSVAMRAHAVQTLERCIVAFGCDCFESGKNTSYGGSALPSTDGERAISLVVGCLLEQIGSDEVQMDELDEDWGTEKERLDLVVSCCKCLGTTIASCGGFLSMSIRSLIESVAVSALSMLKESGTHRNPILTWAPSKVAVLELACSCATTPWQDGASSSIVEQLTIVARQLERDEDVGVTKCAKLSLCICDSIGVSRAPALVYISRAAPSVSSGLNAEALTNSIKMLQQETTDSRKRNAEREIQRRAKPDQKQNQDSKRELEQEAKRQKSHSEKEKNIEIPLAPPEATRLLNTSKEIYGDQIDVAVESVEAPKNAVTVAPLKHNESVDEEKCMEGNLDKIYNKAKSGAEEAAIRPRSVESNARTTDAVDDSNEVDNPASNDVNGDDGDDDDDDLPEIFAAGPDSDEED
jgi:hypothetical protein